MIASPLNRSSSAALCVAAADSRLASLLPTAAAAGVARIVVRFGPWSDAALVSAETLARRRKRLLRLQQELRAAVPPSDSAASSPSPASAALPPLLLSTAESEMECGDSGSIRSHDESDATSGSGTTSGHVDGVFNSTGCDRQEMSSRASGGQENGARGKDFESELGWQIARATPAVIIMADAADAWHRMVFESSQESADAWQGMLGTMSRRNVAGRVVLEPIPEADTMQVSVIANKGAQAELQPKSAEADTMHTMQESVIVKGGSQGVWQPGSRAVGLAMRAGIEPRRAGSEAEGGESKLTGSFVRLMCSEARLVSGEPRAAGPSTPEPPFNHANVVSAEPNADEPIAAESIAPEPTETTAPEHITAEPIATCPVAAAPLAGKPITAEPTTAEPNVAEPTSAEKQSGVSIARLEKIYNRERNRGSQPL
ncbi:unnamed protein product [Closterium sp. Naga37s-1]|nr:unnamed protein product [Closterium sp. Naga37s-1]